MLGSRNDFLQQIHFYSLETWLISSWRVQKPYIFWGNEYWLLFLLCRVLFVFIFITIGKTKYYISFKGHSCLVHFHMRHYWLYLSIKKSLCLTNSTKTRKWLEWLGNSKGIKLEYFFKSSYFFEFFVEVQSRFNRSKIWR